MKFFIDHDEWYPVYEICTNLEKNYYHDGIIEIPDEKFKEYQEIFDKFEKVQAELCELSSRKG